LGAHAAKRVVTIAHDAPAALEQLDPQLA